MTANIESGQEVSREPKWSRRGADHGDQNDYGNTYAEVDLTTQKFWFFQNGQMIMNCDIVTGKPNGSDDTPQGSYDLTYKTKKRGASWTASSKRKVFLRIASGILDAV